MAVKMRAPTSGSSCRSFPSVRRISSLALFYPPDSCFSQPEVRICCKIPGFSPREQASSGGSAQAPCAPAHTAGKGSQSCPPLSGTTETSPQNHLCDGRKRSCCIPERWHAHSARPCAAWRTASRDAFPSAHRTRSARPASSPAHRAHPAFRRAFAPVQSPCPASRDVR